MFVTLNHPTIKNIFLACYEYATYLILHEICQKSSKIKALDPLQ